MLAQGVIYTICFWGSGKRYRQVSSELLPLMHII